MKPGHTYSQCRQSGAGLCTGPHFAHQAEGPAPQGAGGLGLADSRVAGRACTSLGTGRLHAKVTGPASVQSVTEPCRRGQCGVPGGFAEVSPGRTCRAGLL